MIVRSYTPYFKIRGVILDIYIKGEDSSFAATASHFNHQYKPARKENQKQTAIHIIFNSTEDYKEASSFKMFVKTALIALCASPMALALPTATGPASNVWEVTNFSLTDNTGNGLTYSFDIQATADDTDKFATSCTGSTVQAALSPCVIQAVSAVVWSTGVVNGVEGFGLHAAFGDEKGSIQVPSGATSFGLYGYAQ
jgi:hypothetical protein